MNAAHGTVVPSGLESADEVPPHVKPAGRRCAAPPAAGGATGEEAIPERAAGVELIGEMPGTGYRRAPAIARRGDGQLVKLTPLLHLLFGAIDGRRSYRDLAAELSRRSDRQAGPGHVAYLVEQKLRPLGLLAGAEGAETKLERANPLLALRLRFVISNPVLTSRLAAPFTWLFRPAIATPLVAAFALLTWWLLFDKGLAGALHQAFYEPLMILVIWGLVIASAAFHEIGHAAACRYGGARPGVMGAGLYLIWPVFYTEVSDAYRLDRRARLRVDLGGLYFSAIFALATAALWLLTRQDAILLVIAAQLLQMVRQLAPFIRADGYHVLADLTGVPDLFAQIKPTLAGLLPTRWGRPQDSALKPWARALVSGWVLVVVPVLVAILGYLVLFLPRLAATAWDSMGRQWDLAHTYWGEGDPAGVIVAVISIGLVALPVIGISYLFWRLASRTATRVWRATDGRPLPRAASILAAGAIAGVLAWAWWPGDQYQPIGPDEGGTVPGVTPPPVAGLEVHQLWATQTPPAGAGGPPPAAPLAFALAGESPALEQVPPWRDPATPARAVVVNPAPAPPGGEEPSRPAWPFPFDPPAPAGPEDNRALAVNTVDGSVVWDIAVALLVLATGDPVTQANEALALASCRDCRTLAIAFQVILLIGDAEQVTPVNAAGALNYECERCSTTAFAYQLVLSLGEMPSEETTREIEAILDELRELEQQLASMTDEEVYLALEQAKLEILALLADAVSATMLSEAEATDATSTSEPDADRDDESDLLRRLALGDSGATKEAGEDPDSASSGEQASERKLPKRKRTRSEQEDDSDAEGSVDEEAEDQAEAAEHDALAAEG